MHLDRRCRPPVAGFTLARSPKWLFDGTASCRSARCSQPDLQRRATSPACPSVLSPGEQTLEGGWWTGIRSTSSSWRRWERRCGARRTRSAVTGIGPTDVAQDALYKLYVSWPKVSRSNPFAYARRVVVNAAMDSGRRPWRREVPTDRPPDRPAAGRGAGGRRSPGRGCDPAARMCGRMTKGRLKAAKRLAGWGVVCAIDLAECRYLARGVSPGEAQWMTCVSTVHAFRGGSPKGHPSTCSGPGRRRRRSTEI